MKKGIFNQIEASILNDFIEIVMSSPDLVTNIEYGNLKISPTGDGQDYVFEYGLKREIIIFHYDKRSVNYLRKNCNLEILLGSSFADLCGMLSSAKRLLLEDITNKKFLDYLMVIEMS